MTNTKTTKRALFASVLSLLLCVSMLIGSTFAWFTDTASTGVNTIQSGNLDIVLSYKNATQTRWKEVSETDKLFDDNALWEPGYTEVAYLKIENSGSLALKYQLTVNVLNEVAGTNKDDGTIKLSEVLKYDLIELTGDTTYADRAAALTAVSDAKNLATETVSGIMEAKATAKYFALVVYMPTTTSNDANHKTGTTPPSIQLGVNVLATQYTAERDSYDNQYDENALFSNERLAKNDTELAAALAEAGVSTIYLDGDFGAIKLPEGSNGVNLVATTGTKMESLNINGAKNLVVDGLTFDAAKAVQVYDNKSGSNKPTNYTASIYNYRWNGNNFGTAAENVTIKNCTFSGTAVVDSDTEKGYTAVNIDDNGAGTRSANITVEGCTFNCNAVSYIYIQYVKDSTSVVIKNNNFGGEGNTVAWAALAVQQLNGGTAVITNNTFNAWDASDSAVKVSTKAGAPVDAKAVITGNTFNGSVSDDECVVEIRRSGETGHTVSGNTYNITSRTLSDASSVTGDSLSSTVAIWYRQANS